MKRFFKKLFHQHQYAKIGFVQVENSYTRYSLRKYQCQDCGKEKWVDGRFDNN